jgi:protein phosphatase
VIITIPNASLVLLIGPSGAGKSTFARRHFRATEVLSSDFCRALVSDDESDQTATNDAFEVLHLIIAKRLQRRRVTVIDATNVQVPARKPMLEAASQFGVPLIGIVFDLPEAVYQERNRQRTYRVVDSEVISAQRQSLQSSLEGLVTEGFTHVYRLESAEESDSVVVVRS